MEKIVEGVVNVPTKRFKPFEEGATHGQKKVRTKGKNVRPMARGRWVIVWGSR